MKKQRLGIYTQGNSFYEQGLEFKGIGVNHWSAFNSTVVSVGLTTDYKKDFLDIKNLYQIPFVRVAFCPYGRSNWFNKWHKDKLGFIAKLDDFVSYCESIGIRLIPTLLWDIRGFIESTFDVTAITESPKLLASDTSNSWILMAEFISTIVNRYKDSPAILAWTLCNEGNSNLGIDFHSSWKLDGTQYAWLDWGDKPGGGKYLPADKMALSDYHAFTKRAVALIRNIDTHKRAIFSGNSKGNSFSAGVQTTDTLAADTLDKWVNFQPGISWPTFRDKEFGTLTQHIYPQSLTNLIFFSGAEKTAGELVALSKSVADTANVPFFLEEWGATCYGDPSDESSINIASERANFQNILDSIITNDIKLSAVWNYAGDLSNALKWAKWSLTDSRRSYQLDAISAANTLITR